MANAAFFVLFILCLVILIVAGVFITKAAVNMKKNSGYPTNVSVAKAHHYAGVGALITWISVALIVAIIVAAIYFSAGFLLRGFFSIVFMLIAFALCITVGVLAIRSAINFKESSTYSGAGNDKQVYEDLIISASLAIGSTGLIFFAFIAYFVSRARKKKEGSKTTEKISDAKIIASTKRADLQADKIELLQAMRQKKIQDYLNATLNERLQNIELAQQLKEKMAQISA